MEENLNYCYYSDLPSPLAYMLNESEPSESAMPHSHSQYTHLQKLTDKRLKRIKERSMNITRSRLQLLLYKKKLN